MYTVKVSVINLETNTVCRHEIIHFYSETTATYYAKKYLSCADVSDVIVTSDTTGEIVFDGWKD